MKEYYSIIRKNTLSNSSYLVLFLLALLISINAKIIHDDNVVMAMSSAESIFSGWTKGMFNPNSGHFLNFRNLMSPLVGLEAVNFIVFVLAFPLIWVILAYSLNKILGIDKPAEKYFTVAVLMSIPMSIVGEAGFLATTVNYLYPTAFIALAAVGLVDEYKKGRSSLKSLFYLLPSLLACAQEQSAMFLFAISLIMLIVNIVQKHKVAVLNLSVFIISSTVLYLFLGNPWTSTRSVAEQTWFIDWETISFTRKVLLGYQHALSAVFNISNLPVLLLFFLITVSVCNKETKVPIKIISAIPLFIALVFGQNILGSFSSSFSSISKYAQFWAWPWGVGIVDVTNFHSPVPYIACIILAIGTICLLVSTFFAFDSHVESFIAFGVILIGLATSFILGFSPTVWASGLRTTFFQLASVAFVTLMCLRNYPKFNKGVKRSFSLGVLLIFLVSYFNSFVWVAL